MQTRIPTYKQQLQKEINQLPQEYLPNLLQLIRVFRESVALKPASDSFRQGWTEAVNGETQPVSKLWDGIVAN
jgi:hypothetical protein